MKFKEFEWAGDREEVCCNYGMYFAKVINTGMNYACVFWNNDDGIQAIEIFNSMEQATSYVQDRIRNQIIKDYFIECAESRQYLKGYLQSIKDIKALVKEAECEAVTNLFNEAGLELMSLGERKDLIS